MEGFELAFPPDSRTPCRVRFGAGALDALAAELSSDPELSRHRLVVLSDERVAPLHADALAARLGARSITVPRGEACKTREVKSRVEDRLFELGIGGDALLVAVGGGAVGDLAGFVAATWHRGVPVVQAPTSLLAMVDAALGGKTAVNLAGGKNLVGAFHQPLALYADVSLLATLDDHDYTDGFAEIVKSAVIADRELFGLLEREAAGLRARPPALLEQLVGRCLRIKAQIVRADERERGRRAALNFGHTVAHAIEAVSGYDVRHGPAVAAGLVVEARLAVALRGFPGDAAQRVASLVAALGLPAALPAGIEPQRVVEAARRDKKNREGRIHCALPDRLGGMPEGDRITVAVDEPELLRALAN
jgi:3-dehydroquinate synthase